MWLLRMLALGLAMLLSVGFGLCGAYGVMSGFKTAFAGMGWFNEWFLFGLTGLGIGIAFARLVWGALRGKPDAGRSSEQ